MSKANTVTSSPSNAAVAPAPPEAHQSAEREAMESNLLKLPDVCFALIASALPGSRIVLIRSGRRGHYVTRFDTPDMPLAVARVFVDRLNARSGVTNEQQAAMVAGSMFGFHVPDADPDHPRNRGCALRARDGSMSR